MSLGSEILRLSGVDELRVDIGRGGDSSDLRIPFSHVHE